MESRRNVILLTVDSLRADHCGFLGDERQLTPFLDRMAEDSVVFENAIAPGPQTFSSMPAVMTGVHRDPNVVQSKSHEHHWERRLAAIADHLDWFDPIPERLRDLGYSTAGLTPNPWTSETTGFDRGFDHFVDLSGAEDGYLQRVVEGLPGVDSTSKPVEYVLNNLTNSSFFSRWETFYDRLLDLRDALEEPYFLWVFALDPHFPYFASRAHRQENGFLSMYYASLRGRRAIKTGEGTPPEHVGRLLRRGYRDAVRSFDSFVERLWSDVRGDDPVLFLHSDHGESLGERGTYGHHYQVFEENVHVPFFVHDGETARTITEPTSLSTIHDAVTNVARDGWFAPMSTPEYAFVRTELGQSRAVRGRRMKYIDDESEGPMLFDLVEDGGEQENVATKHPELVRALDRHLDHRQQREMEKSRIAKTADSIVASANV